jgi:glycosyltransferase involved in cell wall biosynthesis
MKKVLFVVQGFRQGGANRSLQYLLPVLEQSDVQASVFSLTHQGSYYSVFSKYNILDEDFFCSTLLADLSLEKPSIKRLIRWFFRTVFRLLRIVGVPAFSFFFAGARRKIEQQKFDVIIAFQEGPATNFVAPLQVPVKIAWVHSDYGNYLQLANIRPEINIYKQFTKIVCVSEFTSGVFSSLLPSVATIVSSIPNVMDQETIRRLSMLPFSHPEFRCEGAVMLCVGRLDPVKQFTAIAPIAAELKKKGIQFGWFIIGDGMSMEREAIQKSILLHEVADCVVMLGEIENPYPYISRADVLISLSLSEACPLGVQEAKILHTPVVATDFGSAREFVVQGEGGLVVPLAEMADCLYWLLSDHSQLNQLKQELNHFEFDNHRIIGKIESLLSPSE